MQGQGIYRMSNSLEKHTLNYYSRYQEIISDIAKIIAKTNLFMLIVSILGEKL